MCRASGDDKVPWANLTHRKRDGRNGREAPHTQRAHLRAELLFQPHHRLFQLFYLTGVLGIRFALSRLTTSLPTDATDIGSRISTSVPTTTLSSGR